MSFPLQSIETFAALDVSIVALTAENFSASSFDAELMSALNVRAEPSRVIFEALEASSEQLPASTEASTFEALDVSMVHEVASTAVSIRAALEASMLN